MLASAVGGGAILLTGGIVFAYFATLGTGTGTAQVAPGVSVTQDSTMTGLIPGGAAKPIDFTVTNLSTSAPVEIKNVVIAFGSFAAGCSAADFTLVQPSKPSVSTKLRSRRRAPSRSPRAEAAPPVAPGPRSP